MYDFSAYDPNWGDLIREDSRLLCSVDSASIRKNAHRYADCFAEQVSNRSVGICRAVAGGDALGMTGLSASLQINEDL